MEKEQKVRKDIKVVAKEPGYYGGYYRNVGDEFVLVDQPSGAAEKAFSKTWMERVGGAPAPKDPETKGKPAAKPSSRSVI